MKSCSHLIALRSYLQSSHKGNNGDFESFPKTGFLCNPRIPCLIPLQSSPRAHGTDYNHRHLQATPGSVLILQYLVPALIYDTVAPVQRIVLQNIATAHQCRKKYTLSSKCTLYDLSPLLQQPPQILALKKPTHMLTHTQHPVSCKLQ